MLSASLAFFVYDLFAVSFAEFNGVLLSLLGVFQVLLWFTLHSDIILNNL